MIFFCTANIITQSGMQGKCDMENKQNPQAGLKTHAVLKKAMAVEMIANLNLT